jgi:cellulose synthase/poly-beta-1,6-N-acetylglucosamine synthase-like glycosyltransferase
MGAMLPVPDGLLPGLQPFDGVVTPGGWTSALVFAVLYCMLVDFAKIVVELIGRSEGRAFRSEPQHVTAVVASRNGATELPVTLHELREHLPAERILVVDDASSDGTGELARDRGCNVHRFQRSKGKASAINYSVHRVATPLTLILDDDTRLGGTRIPTSLITDDGYDAVAFHVLPDRRVRDGADGANFLGALQRYEYGKSMAIGRRFHDVTESVSCVSGAVGLFRTADLNRFHHQHTCVFPGEDLQRTIIHLLNNRKIVFADEPAWTIAPAHWGAWFRQRVLGWYPGVYHQIANFVRLLFRRPTAWRLRYEVAYNLYTVASDPLKTLSIVALAITPGMRHWIVVIYLAYLAFEIYPWLVVTVPGEKRRAPLTVLLLYPLYGALNTVVRMLSVATWFWMRYVSGVMRPRRGAQDRTA